MPRECSCSTPSEKSVQDPNGNTYKIIIDNTNITHYNVINEVVMSKIAREIYIENQVAILTRIMAENNLSQVELADKLSLPVEELNDLVLGIKVIDCITAYNICIDFKIPMSDWVTFK